MIARRTFESAAGAVVEAFVEHFAVGEPIPPMPLFLTRENYIRVPLEATYMAAWDDVPPQYQEVLGTSVLSGSRP